MRTRIENYQPENTAMQLRLVSIICSAAALCVSPMTVAAQNVAVGAKGGMASANQNLEVEENDAVSGGSGGLFVTIPIGRYFAIQPEVLLLGKGTEIEDEVLMETVEYEQSFLEVPLLLKVGFPVEGHSVRPFLYVGPSIGFELSCEGEVEQVGMADMDETNDTDPSCGDASLGPSALPTKSTEVSLLIGAGFDFDVGPIFVGLEGRYTHGLTDISNAAGASVKNQVLAAMLSVGIRLR